MVYHTVKMTSCRRYGRGTRGRVAVVLAVALLLSGCASKMVSLRSVPRSPLVERFDLTSRKGPKASPRAKQLLRVNNLSLHLDERAEDLLDALQQRIEREPSPENVHAFTEVSFLAAKKAELLSPERALDLYAACALHAYQYLFDPRFQAIRNPYDPLFRDACDLYNGALESALRLMVAEHGLAPGQTYSLRTASGQWDVVCVLRGSRWEPKDFDHFEFVSDYEIKGLKNHYQTYGLGVPLIAVRRGYEDEPETARHYPPGLSFPVTALLRPAPGANLDDADRGARKLGVIELHDPLSTEQVMLQGQRVPLESDLTTPLAYFLSNPAFSNLSTMGMLRPEELLRRTTGGGKVPVGLYMVQPYESGKIPVVLVHGLWSNPMTWMEMFNDLRSHSDIRRHYQFWFYFYPTAQPFWISAASMRRDLKQARTLLDPGHRQPALDQMVLIGHSMGGLVSRLQTVDSQDDFWKVAAGQPIGELDVPDSTRRELAETFYFSANPSVRRVVSIGTPHRGSNFSNSATRWLSARAIQLPEHLTHLQKTLFRTNREAIPDDSILLVDTSVGSLAPDTPFFQAMLEARRAPWVKYHNIIGLVPEEGLKGWLAAGSDGVVTLESARMSDTESELIVPADHTNVHAHPAAVLEVRRILLRHLEEIRQFPTTAPVHVALRGRLP